MTTTEPVSFVGSQAQTLSAVLHRPDATARGSVLLAHCFTCSKDIHTLTRLAKGLADAGFAALRFDFTGLGESGGDFGTTHVSANVSDLTRAAATLIEMGFGPCGLIGHSLGGAASILAAGRLKTVRWIATIGAPSSVQHITHLFADRVDDIVADGCATVSIAGRSFDLERGFLDDLAKHDVLDAVTLLDRPYLVVHAKDDDVVGFDQGEALFAAASEPKQFLALETGGHLLAPRSAADEVLAGILT